MNKKIDLAYLAGIIDGEGCVTISRFIRNGRLDYRARFNVVSTDEILIDWIQSKFGGYKYERRTHLIKHPTWKVKWEWHLVFSTKSIPLLKSLLPFLIIKRSRLSLVLEYLKTSLGKHGKRLSKKVKDKRENLYNTLKLNRIPVVETKREGR